MPSLDFSKEYEIVYADPPYNYSNKLNKKIHPSDYYSIMSLEDIKKMNVPAEKNSLLFLWSPVPLLIEGLEIMKAWKFRYKSHIVWNKLGNQASIDAWGYYSKVVHELLLIGKRGKFPLIKSKQRIFSVINIRRKKHSEKPIYFRKLIHEWYPDKSKIELFARIQDDNWDSWGNELPDITLVDFLE